MNFSGEALIGAPRAKVWEALNDPEVLRACIPGCDSLDADGDAGFVATIRQRIGPVSATFEGVVQITDPHPPESYRLVGKGSGGMAGFAKGSALVTLVEEGDKTRLRYDAEADLGGKIAQLGGRLIQSVAAKVAADFFSAFGRQVSGEEAAVVAVAAKPKPASHTPARAFGAQVRGEGHGWRMMAFAGWATAIFLGLLVLLEHVERLR